MLRTSLLFVVLFTLVTGYSQDRTAQLPEDLKAELVKAGFLEQDLADVVVKDEYTTRHNGVKHLYLRQRWQGIELWNSDIAVHRTAGGDIARINNGAHPYLAKQVNAIDPVITAQQALDLVLSRTLPGAGTPALVSVEDGGRKYQFDGTLTGGTPINVQLYLVPTAKEVRLAWNVNHYTSDGSHWWNIRIDALTGQELDRNDWVSQCGIALNGEHEHASIPELPPAPAAPNDYNVYPWPLESPSHGPRALVNAPWLDGGAASPFGWHDTDGTPGAEHTITKGNNVQAQEDTDNNNTGGFSPNGGATLDFDFPIDLTQAPSTYQSAAITNLFYWNNLMHDVWYQYGFDDASGNFQQNNYGRGGAGNDFVIADAYDGSGTNNANFGTPPDGSSPRMQMFVWTAPNPDRTSDLDNGIIAHEYGHGISNRLVAGPSNVNCLANAEQMGEGWSDYFSLVMTIKAGDVGSTARGIGTYALGQPVTGAGIRPAPYSTNMAVNDYTYANTNSGVSQPHGIGFVWCTMLWEMTWELIGVHGLDPDIYNGTGGNNIAMQLVIDGMKLTPCNPGFVDARDAILLADVLNNGGANQASIWAAFARRGLGASASQGSSASRSDADEAFDLPLPLNVGIAGFTSPSPLMFDCAGTTVPVIVTVRNYGTTEQSGFPVSYAVNGGTPVTETFTGTLAPGASASFQFNEEADLVGPGPIIFVASSSLSGDQFTGNDNTSTAIDLLSTSTVTATYLQDVESGSTTPPGWTLQNLDASTSWSTSQLTNGALCAASRAWSINYYSYNAPGQEDRLTSPFIDLSNSAGTRLKFHHAYAPYATGYDDGLRVDVSADCGATWNTVFLRIGSQLATAPTSVSAWSPTNCSQWQLNDLDLGTYDGGSILVRFSGINGYGNNLYFDNVTIESNGVSLSVKLLLEGSYNSATDRMRDDLRVNGQLPTSEPYTALGFVQAGNGGAESADASVFTTTGDNAIVDWVLLELRSAVDPTTLIATRCALVQRDGDVVDKDGLSPVVFLAGPGNYHVVVRHRNHLGVMTATAVSLSGAPFALDLTTSSTATFGTEARKTVNGRAALWAGNVLRDGTLRYSGESNDRDPILQAIGGSVPTNTSVLGYYPEDVNMDGVTRYTGTDNDRDPVLLNIGGSVPTNTRAEQLP
jgi:hypothetical protein